MSTLHGSSESGRVDSSESGRVDSSESGRVDEGAIHAGHERDVVGRRLIWTGGLGLLALLVLAVVAVYLIQPLFVASQEAENPPPNPLAEVYGRAEPPAPRLQVDPALDIVEHRKREEQLLTSYGWVDEKGGVVRIPIARAIEILAERGLPEPAGPAGTTPAPGRAPGAGEGAAP